MSWDIVLFSSTEKIVSVKDLDETQLVPINFDSILENHFHPNRKEDWREVDGPDYAIEYSVSKEDTSNTILHLYGEKAIYAIIELAKKHNWQIFDTGLGEMIDLENPSKNGYANFQEYLKHVLKSDENDNEIKH